MRQRPHEALTGKEDVVGCDVLIFSANKGFSDHHRAVFMSMGFRPITVATPEPALAILRLMVVVFAVVDQGVELSDSRRILERAREAQQHTPVLVIAQNPHPNSRRAALARGAAGYLNHPALRGDIVHALVASEARERRPADGSQQE